MSWAVLQDLSIEEVLKYSGKPEPWILRVAHWWEKNTKGVSDTIPLSCISLVLVRVDTLGALYDKKTHLVPVVQRQGPPTRPFLLYYAIPPGQASGWQGAIHILGLGLADKADTTAVIGDLLHTHEYALEPDASLRWLGSSNEDFWIKFCFEPPSAAGDESVSTEYIAYRAQLADVFWTNRNNAAFTQQNGDGYEMLVQLHEGQSGIEHLVAKNNAAASDEERAANYFELCNDRGRAHEYISYWMFALSAALAPRDSFAKKKRVHFERELLRFRLQRYFFKDAHFLRLVKKNRLVAEDRDEVLAVTEPGDRERELHTFRRQKASAAATRANWSVADEEPPRLWISVPEQHAGKEIVGDPLYDIDEGRVIITRHELFQWAWTRMEVGMRRLTSHLADGHKQRVTDLQRAQNRQTLFPHQLAPICIPCDAGVPDTGLDDEDTRPAADDASAEAGYWSMFPEEHRLLVESQQEAMRAEAEMQRRYNKYKDKEKDNEAPPTVYYSIEEQRYWLRSGRRRRNNNAMVHLTPSSGPPLMPLETARGLLQMDMALRQLHYAAKAEDDRDNAAIEALRQMRLGGGGGSSSLDGLTLERVKRSFPPCMGRIVMDALVHRVHPKHKPRVSLVKFLLEAGFSVPDVDKLIYDMYEADRDYVYNEHQGRWDKEAYDTVFKDAVKNLHTSIVVSKHISPYGCAHLTGYSDREQRGEQKDVPPALYGCPFSSSVPGQRADMSSARSYLQWAGVQAPDIEDIVKPGHPQLCCSKYYLERFPDNNGLTINHPNQFVRGAVLVDVKKKRQKIDLSQDSAVATATTSGATTKIK